jgi:cytoskeletal protein RodZ
MQANELDRLFKEKLAQHSEPVQKANWEALAGRLQQKKKKSRQLYWQIAAAVLILMLGSWAVLRYQTETTRPIAQAPQQTPDKTIEQPAVQPEAEGPMLAEQTPKAEKASEALEVDTTEGNPSKEKAQPQIRQKQPVYLAQETENKASDEDQPVLEMLPEALPKENKPTLLASHTPDIPEIVLEKQPAEVAEKEEVVIIEYIPDNSPTYLAKAENKEATGGKKLLSFLKKVKNTELSLSDLREAKNELIAARLNP